MFSPDYSLQWMTEYFKLNSEVQIRNADCLEIEKECLINEASNRIVKGGIWVLGALAHWGFLEK